MPQTNNNEVADVLRDITRSQIIPVVVLNDAERADGLGQALVEGGLPVAEVTFRTRAAEAAIRALADRGDVLVGAGTVLTPEQVDLAAGAGARFIVSPGLAEDVVRRAQDLGLDALPGCVTASEVMRAVRLGLEAVKFFPASTSGGAPAIKALSAPFAGLQFIPTGGVGPKNLGDYLELACVPAVGGSWMVPAHLVDAGDFAAVTALTREAVALAAELNS